MFPVPPVLVFALVFTTILIAWVFFFVARQRHPLRMAVFIVLLAATLVVGVEVGVIIRGGLSGRQRRASLVTTASMGLIAVTQISALTAFGRSRPDDTPRR